MRTPYPGYTDVDQQDLILRASEWSSRFLELARHVDPALDVSEAWTVRDVVGHVFTVICRYTRRDVFSREGVSDDAEGLHRQNQDELAALAGRSMAHLLDDLQAETAALVAQLSAPLDLAAAVFPFHGGIMIDGAAGLANIAGEFMIHGRDIATAAHRPWHVRDDDLRPLVNLLLQAIEPFVLPTARDVTVEFEIPAVERFVVEIANRSGGARRAFPTLRPDVRVRVPTSTFVLMMYGRIGSLEALRGGMRVVGGRRPWRIGRLRRAFATA